jgi:hypothetical protein
MSTTFLFTTGRRMPYSYLLTRMKSPISSVGIIEPDGILNGSTTNERSTNTARITGKKLAEYSSHHGWRSFSSARRLRVASASAAPKRPCRSAWRESNSASASRAEERRCRSNTSLSATHAT